MVGFSGVSKKGVVILVPGFNSCFETWSEPNKAIFIICFNNFDWESFIHTLGKGIMHFGVG